MRHHEQVGLTLVDQVEIIRNDGEAHVERAAGGGEGAARVGLCAHVDRIHWRSGASIRRDGTTASSAHVLVRLRPSASIKCILRLQVARVSAQLLVHSAPPVFACPPAYAARPALPRSSAAIPQLPSSPPAS